MMRSPRGVFCGLLCLCVCGACGGDARNEARLFGSHLEVLQSEVVDGRAQALEALRSLRFSNEAVEQARQTCVALHEGLDALGADLQAAQALEHAQGGDAQREREAALTRVEAALSEVQALRRECQTQSDAVEEQLAQ